MMGLLVLIVGLVIFIGAHVFVTRREARAAVIARIGLMPYRVLFGLVSLAGIVVIAWGFADYRATGYIQVWSPPQWMRYVTQLLVWPAIIFATAAYVRGDIARKLKHPLLVGIKLWAFAHLLSNGDLGGIILFGAILGWAVFDRITLKHRSDAGAPAIPYGGRRNDMIAVVAGTILYLALGLVFHPLFIGIPVFGRPALGM
jgi:uncharacterized membrane protein